MANRSYPPFGKVKTIVFSAPSTTLTLKEYQDKFGIDLKSFLKLDEVFKGILFDCNNSQIFIKIPESTIKFLYPVTNYDTPSYWDEGNDDATLILGWYNASDSVYEGLQFDIDKDASFSLENVKVHFFSI